MEKETALENLRRLCDKLSSIERTALETLIPELAESEDEKIRKKLISLFQSNNIEQFGEFTNKQFVDWLEKQGEQKPVECYEKYIADVFEKVGLAKIVRELDNDALANALQDAMIEIEKQCKQPTDEEMKTILQTEYEKGRADVIAEFEQGWTEEDTDTLKWICRIIFRAKQDSLITQEEQNEIGEWIDKWLNHSPERKEQGEQNTIVNKTPSREMILAVWDLGNIWKELTEGNPCTEYGTQLQYIQNHWNESPYCEILKQNHTDKITPKFKIGDWVVKNDDSNVCADYSICKITNISIENGTYTIESIYGYKGYVTFKTFEKDYHIFTIEEDAKDGDVLAIGYEYFLFKEKKEDTSPLDPPVYTSHCFVNSSGAFRVTNGRDCGEFYSIENGISACPATKEQRDLLFQNMKEAGYEWNAYAKTLTKVAN